MNPLQTILILAGCAASLFAQASLLGVTVGGQLSDPFTSQLFDNDSAVGGAGDEFPGYVSVGGSSTLAYYAEIGESTVTIGIRPLGPFAIVSNANPFTWQISGLESGCPGDIQDFALTLWPSDADPNASWIGWAQDAEIAPLWNPVWDVNSSTPTIVATDGWTIPPGYDVFATFGVVVPPPPALMLMVSALGLLALGWRRRTD